MCLALFGLILFSSLHSQAWQGHIEFRVGEREEYAKKMMW